jgi:hypothetical protein
MVGLSRLSLVGVSMSEWQVTYEGTAWIEAEDEAEANEKAIALTPSGSYVENQLVEWEVGMVIPAVTT